MSVRRGILQAVNEFVASEFETPRRYSTFDCRYQAGNEYCWESFSKFDQALRYALSRAKIDPGVKAWIADRCARKGKPKLWEIEDNHFAVVKERNK